MVVEVRGHAKLLIGQDLTHTHTHTRITSELCQLCGLCQCYSVLCRTVVVQDVGIGGGARLYVYSQPAVGLWLSYSDSLKRSSPDTQAQ